MSRAVFPAGRLGFAFTHIASGSSVIGNRYSDGEGNEYQLVLATDEAIADGSACVYKSGNGASGVLLSNVLGIGGSDVFAGVAILDKDANNSAAQGECFYIQTKGECFGRTNAASIVFGDKLVPSTSGTFNELSNAAAGSGFAAEALAAGAGLGTTTKSRILLK